MEEETGEDTIQAAHKTRQHQGYHEAEVTFGGEADLHKHYRRCKKNPGHTQFIPIGDFKIEHLPPDYRDNLLLDYIRAEADVTCRLSVRYTSESRPKFHPEHPHLFYPFYQDRGYDWMRVGTGWVNHVHIYKEKDGKNCICEECRLPGTQIPKKKWAEVDIHTACHVVFSSDEARHTTCHLFYDEGSTHISQCPSLTGLSVDVADIKKDRCEMTCVIHDMDLVNKLDKMNKHRDHLRNKVHEKYMLNKNVSCDSDPTSRLTVIISHPHGLSKQVTVGEWTQRQILSPPTHKSETGYEFVGTSYSYNTATCPGSSGAHVITLSEDRPWWWYYRHPHSEGGDGNNNKSGVALEHLPSSSVLIDVDTDDEQNEFWDQFQFDSFHEIFMGNILSGEVHQNVNGSNDVHQYVNREDEDDDSFSTDLDSYLSSSFWSDTTDGVSDDEVERNLSGKGRNELEDESPPKESNEEPKEDVSKKQDKRPGISREDEEDDSTSHTITLSTSSSTNVRSDTTDGVSDDEDVKNVRQNKQRSAARERKLSESEDETPPKEKNQEPKGDVSKGEDSTEMSTGGRTSNEADDSKSMGAATATGKATTSSGALKKKGKAPKNKKQKKKNFLVSDSDLDDDDDVDHHNNDDDDGDVHCDHYNKDDEDKEDDKSCDLSDDVQHDVKCFNRTGNQAD